MTYKEFVDKYTGKGIDYDNFYGFQCMDLAHQYATEVVGHDIPAAPGAKDVWDKDCPGYDKITNTPDGVPAQGDIVIWGTAIGAYGHIAVFDSGNPTSFTSFDQNWPLNSLCHLQNHNYTGVLGWLHPQSAPAVITTPSGTVINWTQKTIVPLDAPYYNQELGAVNSMLKDKDATIKALQNPPTDPVNTPNVPPVPAPEAPKTADNPNPVSNTTSSFWIRFLAFLGLQ